jgi:hypothetical protein
LQKLICNEVVAIMQILREEINLRWKKGENREQRTEFWEQIERSSIRREKGGETREERGESADRRAESKECREQGGESREQISGEQRGNNRAHIYGDCLKCPARERNVPCLNQGRSTLVAVSSSSSGPTPSSSGSFGGRAPRA